MAKAEKITKAPSEKVKNLSAPKRIRNSHKMTASWGIPSDLVSTKKNDRAESLKVTWKLFCDGKDPKEVDIIKKETTKTDSVNLSNFKAKSGNRTKTYTRDSFYPITGKNLHSITVTVQAKNRKGVGKGLSKNTKFELPRKPTFSGWSFNGDNGRISITVNTDAGEDLHERYDTKYNLTVTDPFHNPKTFKVYTNNDSSTSTSSTLSYDATNYMRLSYTQYIKVVATAYARGYKGDNPSSKNPVSSTAYISYPAKASITGVDCPSGRDATGKCTVRINTNYNVDKKINVEHPVDKVRLQIAPNVTTDNPNDLTADDWESTEIVDNNNCSALSIATSDLLPERGNYTFVRVVTYHLNEERLYRYSDPVRVKALEVPATPPASIAIDIVDVYAGSDGKSAVVTLGWNKDGRDDFTGTELSWSDSLDTWKSTEEPSTHQFTWSDGKYYEPTNDTSIVSGKTYYTRSGEGTEESPYVYTAVQSPTQEGLSDYFELLYNDSAEIVIKGLNEETTYYIKARRYLEADNEEYSAYSNVEDVTTGEIPDSVTAMCAGYIASGYPLSVNWTLAGNGIQSKFEIPQLVNGAENGVNLVEGEGSVGTALVTAERLSELAIDNTVNFKVRAYIGTKPVESEPLTVSIIEAPTLTLTAPTIMMAQPYSFTAHSNALCDLTVVVTSRGITGQFPEGVLAQATGDTVYSTVIANAEWTDGDAAITLPSGLNFWDGGTYTLSVIAEDRTSGLRTSPVTAEFTVAWENQAVSPVQFSYELTDDTTVDEDEAYYELIEGVYSLVQPEGNENPSEQGWYTQNVTTFVTLTVIDEVDNDGDHTQAVRIDMTPPTGSRDSDVYDIYRMDIDKPSLISGEVGFPLTSTATDMYAPFGKDEDLRYRIAIRTVDGDVEFADIEYKAECENIRFDWSGGSLELPYGNSIADSFAKDTEIRKHMDGVSTGYWRRGVERKSSLSSSIIKIVQPRDIERTRLLARYAGPVFVRLPNGSAFEADVQVTDLSIKNEAVVAVAFDATEIGLTNEFSLPTPYTLEEDNE